VVQIEKRLSIIAKTEKSLLSVSSKPGKGLPLVSKPKEAFVGIIKTGWCISH